MRSDYLHPAASLLDALRAEDQLERIEAMQRLPAIALALGPERTLKELLGQYLPSVIDDEDDEVLQWCALKLPELLDPLPLEPFAEHNNLHGGSLEEGGGVRTQMTIAILSLLTLLACKEEKAVRDAAVDSFRRIVSDWLNANGDDIKGKVLISEQIVWPMVKDLCQGHWAMHRASGAHLLDLVLACPFTTNATIQDALFLKEAKEILLQLCSESKEASGIVRRAAIQHLALCLPTNARDDNDEILAKDLQELILSLMNDPQDSIRMSVVPVVWEVCQRQSIPDTLGLELLRMAALDGSWRTRHALATSLPHAITAIRCRQKKDDPESEVDFLGIHAGLLGDSEATVREEAAKHLPAVIEALISGISETRDAVLKRVLNELLPLVGDPVSHVRSAVASVIAPITVKLFEQKKIQIGEEKDELISILSSLITRLLHDEDAEVRLAIIQHFGALLPVMGVQGLVQEALLPAIRDLHTDAKWRVRLAIVEQLPLLGHFFAASLSEAFLEASPSFGAAEKGPRLLLPFLRDALQDDVFAVRKGAAECLGQLGRGKVTAIRRHGFHFARVGKSEG